MTKENQESKKPILNVNVGAFQGSIFMNTIKGKKDGKEIEVPSVSFQKSWTSDGKNWERQKMNFFNATEIDKAILVLEKVKEHLYTKDYKNTEETE